MASKHDLKKWRAYAAKNRERLRTNRKAYYVANRERLMKQNRDWCKKNRAKRVAARLRYVAKNKEKIDARDKSEKRKAQRSAYYFANRESIRKKALEYYLAHKPPPKPRKTCPPRPRMSDDERRRRARERSKKQQLKNQEAYRARWREFYRKHKAKRLALQREYASQNREQKKAYMRRRNFLKRLRRLEADLAKMATKAGINTKGTP